MIQHIIRLSVRNKLFVLLGTIALIIWGGYALTKLPLDAIPDVTNNQVVVATQAPNLSAVEMEQFVTYPVEIAMRNIPGLEGIRSVSQFGLSIITLDFKDKVDLYFARSQVNERLQAVKDEIPTGFGTPAMNPVTTGLGEIYQYIIKPVNPADTSWSDMELRSIQDWVVKKQLLGVEGVAEISSFGGQLKQWHVRVNPDLLRSTGVTLQEVYNAVSSGNENTGAAYIEKDARNYFIRGLGIAHDAHDLEMTLVKVNSGTPVLVRDVASVELGSAIRYGALTQNDHEAVGGIVLMLKGANSRQVVLNIKARMEQVKKSLPKGLAIESFLDRELLIDRTVKTVSRNLMEGGLIVILVLVLLLGHLRAGFIVASVIPLAMLFAIGCMVLFGVSGNLMSLGAIDFGLIVDGAVIIVENIVRLLHERVGGDREKIVEEGAAGMVQSSFFGQIIILIVYLPLLTLSGIEGKMFQPMAMTVIFALAGAVILSLTYVPAVSALLLKGDHSHSETFSDRLVRVMLRVYQPIIRWALEYKKTVVALSLCLLALATVMFNRMGGEFIPQLDEGDFVIEIRMMPGASLTQMVKSAEVASTQILKNFPNEVISCTGKIGTSEVPMDPMSIEEMDMVVSMHDRSDWKRCNNRQDFEAQLKVVLDSIPGIYTSIQQPIAMRFNELMTGAKTDIIIKVLGNDLDKLADFGNEIVQKVSGIPGAADVSVAKAEGLPQIFVTWRRDALARYGVQINDANAVLRMAMAGMKAGILFEENRRFDVIVNLATNAGQPIETISALQITGSGGIMVPLHELAQVEIKDGPMAVFREDGERCINVNMNVRGRDVQSLVSEVQNVVAQKIDLPESYRVSYGGQFENLQNASARLKLVVPAALLMILLLLYLTFNRIQESLLIFSAIPFAAVGGVFALWLRDMPFSISAGVGFIALFGVAVLNGMVLIGYFKQLEREMAELMVRERVLQGVFTRFRPVIMTATVASLGFLPMAISHGAGAEVQKPLATVVIGGLITATLLTLVVLPVLYEWLANRKKTSIPPVASILLVMFGLGLSNTANAQEILTEQAAVQQALLHHPAMQAREISMRKEETLLPASRALVPAQLYAWGPFNPEFGITQEMEHPALRRANYAMQTARIGVAGAEKALTARDVQREVRLVYEKGVFWQGKRSILTEQDSVLSAYARAASTERQVGAINEITRLNAEARAKEAKLQTMQANEMYRAAMDELRLLIGAEATKNFKLEPNLSRRPLPDTTTMPSALTKYWDANAQMAESEQNVWQKKRLPGFTFGVVTNVDPYNRLLPNAYIGMSLPLSKRAQRAQVDAAMLNRSLVGAHAAQQQLEYRSRLRDITARLRAADESLALLATFGADRQTALLEAAETSRRIGETSAFEYLQTVATIFELKLRRLEALHAWNEAAIELEQ
jgi:cobalt-zinc-cadmium resistance protein CzcA